MCMFSKCSLFLIILELLSFLRHFQEFTGCCEFFGGFWGLVGTVLDVFGPSWALWGPKNGLSVLQERTKSSPRAPKSSTARFSKMMIYLQWELDLEAPDCPGYACSRALVASRERLEASWEHLESILELGTSCGRIVSVLKRLRGVLECLWTVSGVSGAS